MLARNIVSLIGKRTGIRMSSHLGPRIEFNHSDLVRNIRSEVPADIKKFLTLGNAHLSEVAHHKKAVAMEKFKRHSIDTGSTPVQIAALTERINHLTFHSLKFPKDHGTKRSMQKLVHRRWALLNYLKRTDFDSFNDVVKVLELKKEIRRRF